MLEMALAVQRECSYLISMTEDMVLLRRFFSAHAEVTRVDELFKTWPSVAQEKV